MNPKLFETYLQELQKNLSTGVATEHTHRSALKGLLEAIDDDVLAINEPKRVECGAPDYIVTRASTPLGYIEAKDVGTSLDTAEKSGQMVRYFESLNNLILTEAFSEILRLHEKRDWHLSEREIQWRIKSLRGEFYRRRRIQEIQKRQVILTPEPNTALQNVLSQAGSDIRLVILPEGRTTIPKEKLYQSKRKEIEANDTSFALGPILRRLSRF